MANLKQERGMGTKHDVLAAMGETKRMVELCRNGLSILILASCLRPFVDDQRAA